MRAVFLVFLFLISYCVSGQDVISDVPFEETFKLIKLSEVCTCSEIPDAEGTHLVLNILCSELDKIGNVADLDKIEWPPNPNGLKISASFEGLGLTTIGKLPPNSQVESLRFSNNAIKTYWPDPFSDVPNLLKLSFAQNELKAISPDLFTEIHRLQDLDLSYNKITDFNPMDFEHMRMVKRLNLQSNQLSKVPLEALIPMVALEDLDLSKNSIYDVLLLRSDGVGLSSLKRLNLNSNRIRSVNKHSFPVDNKLELLDISNNLIEIIEEDAFTRCTNLKELNLRQNNITLVFELPPALQIAILKENAFFHWPMFPSGIKYIDLSYNRLSGLYDETAVNFENLEILNIGGNQLKDLDIQKSLANLFVLDLSYNMIKEIPITLSEQFFPNLEELRIDGNPIENIYFNNAIVLKNLYVNDLDKLVKVDDKAFSNVVGRGDDETEDSRCFYLYLSNCHSLSEIHPGAFDGTSLCMLDLSKNNLTNLPRDLLPWQSVAEGVNLQFNPWRCNCQLQWMIDELLPYLYTTNSSYLLDDLRCGSPPELEHLRLVHWYNWTAPPMCAGASLRASPHDNYSLEPSTDTGLPYNISMMTLILSICIVISLMVAIALTVYLIATRKRYRIRRAALKRKRQSAIDAVNTNGTEKEQFAAFNRT